MISSDSEFHSKVAVSIIPYMSEMLGVQRVKNHPSETNLTIHA